MCSIQMIVRAAGVDAADRLDQLVAFALGQPAGDLVEQQQPRIGGQRARQLQPLAVEQRQRAGDAVGARDQSRSLEDLGAGVDDVALAPALAEARRRPAGSRTPSASRTAAGSGSERPMPATAALVRR